MTRLITAGDLAEGMETVLVADLPGLIETLGLEDLLKPVRTWKQLPTIQALTEANMPAGAITSPGLASPPTRKGSRVDATWRIVVSLFDRDVDHTATTQRIQQWAALIRAVGHRNPSLGGIATSTTWVGERYELIPARSAARTLAGCSVDFNVSARDVVDVDDLPVLQTVQTVHPSLTVHRGEPA